MRPVGASGIRHFVGQVVCRRAASARLMVFNSLAFLVFLAVVLALDYRFLGLLLFTSLFDYVCALKLEAETYLPRRKMFLAFSIMANMGVLGIFKYFDFFASSLQSALGSFGLHPSFPTLHVILPVGISFYTFLSMSYTIDVYRGELKATRNPLDFMLYVAFFPHLVAGPI